MFLVCVLTGVENLCSVISLFRYVKGKENKDGSMHTMKACRSNGIAQLKVCKFVHHRSIQINHQPDATIF